MFLFQCSQFTPNPLAQSEFMGSTGTRGAALEGGGSPKKPGRVRLNSQLRVDPAPEVLQHKGQAEEWWGQVYDLNEFN